MANMMGHSILFLSITEGGAIAYNETLNIGFMSLNFNHLKCKHLI